MAEPDLPGRAPVPIERLAADLRRLYVRLGGDPTDTSAVTWTRRSPEEWAETLALFDEVLVAACAAVGADVPDLAAGERLPGPTRATLMDALAAAGMDVRRG